MIRRLQRDTVIAIFALAAVAAVWRPRDLRFALGVIGGGLLAGLSYWAIRGAVASIGAGGRNGGEDDGPVATAEEAKPRDFRPVSRLLVLVKFFTRHAILALAAYGMMTRLRLDPVGLLIGVSAPGIAAAIESIRFLRRDL